MLEFLLYLLAIVGAVFVTLLAVGFIRLTRLRRRLDRQLRDAGVSESTTATLFGRASAGQDQKPGPGLFGVSDGALAFASLAGEPPLVIERDQITSVSQDRQFMGRTARLELLVVTWDQHGMGDAAAFAVQDVGTWQQRISS